MTSMDLRPLLRDNGSKIVLYVWDGLGGIPAGPEGKTELEAADTPNADRLLGGASCGLLEPVAPGITPGSGPGHLALFGYDPLEFQIGRGALEAVGVGFDFRHGDVAARLNFCTLDKKGIIIDRRAGRIPTEESSQVVARLAQAVRKVDGIHVLWAPVKEHRALLVLRGKGLGDGLADTDPQKESVPPLDVRVTDKTRPSARTAQVVRKVLKQAMKVLAAEKKANGVLARGFAKRPHWPSMQERFGLHAAVIAGTPMYRGVARLVGMEALDATNDIARDVASMAAAWDQYNFFFIHYKHTDKAGEDGDFAAKVRYIQEADAAIQAIEKLSPDVLIVTADHSTPSAMKGHSWHPVPVLLWARMARREGPRKFCETACVWGHLGLRPSKHLMPLALAHAGRLAKFGA